MKEQGSAVATASQTAGPFFHLGLKPQRGATVAATGQARTRLLVTVTDGDGKPVDDALIECWQKNSAHGAVFTRAATGPDGTCEIETSQAPHINVCVFARGLLRHLHTRIYFAGDAAIESDPVLALVPSERRQTLIARPDAAAAGRWRFDLRLQGAGETVFFDV